MTPQTRLLLMLLGAVAVVIVVFLATAPDDLPAPTPADRTAVRPSVAGSETPDKDNVSHTFRMEVAQLEQRLAEAPDDTTALVELALMQQDAHQTAEAAAHYERYLALRPGNRQAWLDLANCYGELEQWTDAEGASLRMLTHYPDDPAGMYNLGAIYANLGRVDEARGWWEKTRDQQTDPDLAAQAGSSLIQLAHNRP